MRAFIKRSKKCKEILSTIEIAEDGYFDQSYWLNFSGESFHGEISDTRDSFIFNDVRLPNFELPLPMVKIDG